MNLVILQVSSSLIFTALWVKLSGSSTSKESQAIHSPCHQRAQQHLIGKHSLKLALQVPNILSWAAASASRKQTLIKEPNRIFCLIIVEAVRKNTHSPNKTLLNEGQ